MSVKVKVCDQCGQKKKIGGSKKRCKTCRSGLTAKERSVSDDLRECPMCGGCGYVVDACMMCRGVGMIHRSESCT
jgi:hypothetical protein